jgi:hypothetical protein
VQACGGFLPARWPARPLPLLPAPTPILQFSPALPLIHPTASPQCQSELVSGNSERAGGRSTFGAGERRSLALPSRPMSCISLASMYFPYLSLHYPSLLVLL